ncbi:MAG: helix-turn-helix domain-containing protein [Polaromonas sp.]
MATSSSRKDPMQNHPENVLESMKPQLVPGDRESNQALPVSGDDDLDDFEGDSDSAESVRGMKCKGGATLKLVIGRRISAAREMNGLLQSQLAEMLGFSSSAQLCLWEAGKRLPPLYCITLLSTNLSVSVDWLLGLDPEPERDSATAARNATVRRMADLLDRNARAVADVLLETHRFDPAPELRSTKICSLVVELCDSVDRYRAANVEAFEDSRCSALLMRTARDAREAIGKISLALDRADFRTEHALKKSREALHAPIPELPPGPGGMLTGCRL